MPRDASANYTRPSNSFSTPTPATSISSTDADATFDDFETALDQSAIRTPQYLVVSASPGLPNERVFTAGGGLTSSDGGAGLGLTVAVGAGTGITINADDVSLSAIASNTVLANRTASSTAPSATPIADLFEAISSARGSIMYRGAAGWVALAPATAGKFLGAFGAGADVAWDVPAGGGGAGSATPVDGVLINGGLVALGSSTGVLTIAVKTQAGSDPSTADPVTVVFRDAASTTGGYTRITLSGAATYSVSKGSSHGVAVNTPFRYWIVGLNDTGSTFRLGTINCRSTSQLFPLVEFGLQSTSPEGGIGASDSAGVIYSGDHSSATVTLSTATNAVTWTSHGLSTNQSVVFTTTGALFTGVTAGTTYYVRATGLLTNTFQISSTVGGSAIQVTGSQSGTHTAHSGVFQRPMRILGFIDYNSGLTTAGDYTSNPTIIERFGQGTPKPGEIIQSVVATGGTQVFSSAASYLDIGSLTATITLTSPVNQVAYAWDTPAQTAQAGDSAVIALRRGGSVVGNAAAIYSANGNFVGMGTGGGADFPASVGPNSYVISIQKPDGTGSAWAPANIGGAARIQLAEIMS